MTTSLLNSLLRALLRWGAALVFCLPLRHRPHFWARACGMLLPLLLLAQLLDPLAQSTTLWQQQLLLLVLYISFFALLGGMIYLCTDINKKVPCTAQYGACSSRSAPTRAGAFWSCSLPGMDTR